MIVLEQNFLVDVVQDFLNAGYDVVWFGFS